MLKGVLGELGGFENATKTQCVKKGVEKIQEAAKIIN